MSIESFTPTPNTMFTPEAPGVVEATALHRARLQELMTPSVQAETALLASLQAATTEAFASEYVGPEHYKDIPVVAEGFRWLVVGKPGEPMPEMCEAYTHSSGYPVMSWRRDISGGLQGVFQEATHDARKAIADEVALNRDEIEHELTGLIELSPGYRLCEDLLTPASMPATGNNDFRHAEVQQRITSRYSIAMSGIKNNHGIYQDYTRSLQRVDYIDGYAFKSKPQGDASLERARAHFYPLLADTYRRNNPGKPVPEDLVTPKTKGSYDDRLMHLAIEVAYDINGKGSCPAAHAFLEDMIISVFSASTDSFADRIQRQKASAAQSLYGCYQRLTTTGMYGGSSPRWWIRELAMPPVLSVEAAAEMAGVVILNDTAVTEVDVSDEAEMAVDEFTIGPEAEAEFELEPESPEPYEPEEAPEKDTSPATRQELIDTESTRIGNILIDQRPESAAVSRRLIMTMPRLFTLSAPRTDANPTLRISFNADVAAQYEADMPYIPGFITVAEVVGPDGSRTFDFVREDRWEDPYVLCTEPFEPEQREAITGFYENIEAKRMVKNLRASRNLRIGDIEDLMARSSRYYAPKKDEGGPEWFVKRGYLHLQCLGAANLTADSLIASGVAPATSFRVISGYVLPEKGEPLVETGHASVEYTDKTGRVFILDPPIIYRNAPDIELEDEELPVPEVVAAPEVPEVVMPDAFDTVRNSFERLVARSFGIGTEVRPARSDQVWRHIQLNCRRPGDAIAMTAALVDHARDGDPATLDLPEVSLRMTEVREAADMMRMLTDSAPSIRMRAGNYEPAVYQTLLHVLNGLHDAYEDVLPKPATRPWDY